MDSNERFWSLVNDGKLGPLQKFLAQNKDVESLDFMRVCDDFEGDGENVLIQCVKKLGDKPSGFGRDHLACIRCLVEHGVDLSYTDRSGKTALHWAVCNRHASLVKGLIKIGADKNIFDEDGLSPFHIAVQTGAKACVRVLCNGDEEILDFRDGWGIPPLSSAVQQGIADMCELLLEKGADVNLQERRKKRTALHHAVYKKRLDIFELLIRANAKLDLVDHKRTTILHRCCGINDPRFLQKIIDIHENLPRDLMELESEGGATALLVACQNGNSQQLKELLDQGASINVWDSSGQTPLHHCAENLETQCAEMILETEGSDMLLNKKEEQGLTTMQMTVIAGNAPLLKLLLAKGADKTCVDNENRTVAHWATVCGHVEVFEVLLEHGADLSKPDSHQGYPIHYAAQAGSVRNGDKILKLMLDNEVPVNVCDADERQALLWAASSGNAETCETLVKSGADVNAVDKDGLTALHCAASRGHDACIEVLKKLGANCNKADKNNCTPIYYSVTLGNNNCTKLLLKLGSDPNHMDAKGRTPSHCAAVRGCLETVEMLEKEKAEMWIPCIKGDLPLHEAAQGGHCDVVTHLLKQRNTPDAVNSKNSTGRTSLHIAAIINNLQLCKLLLDNGADINAIMTNKGNSYTPYDAAVLKEHIETADYLKSKGAVTAVDAANIQPEPTEDDDCPKSEPTEDDNRPKSAPTEDDNRPKSAKSGKSITVEKTIQEEEETEAKKENINKPEELEDSPVSTETSGDESDNADDDADADEEDHIIAVAEENNVTPMEKSVTVDKKMIKHKTVIIEKKPKIKKTKTAMDQRRRQVKPENSRNSGTRSKQSSELQYKDSKFLLRPASRSKTARDIQRSVMRYQSQRTYIRQLHQIKRAQIYTGPLHDVSLYNLLMMVHIQGRNDDQQGIHSHDNWESYVLEQQKSATDLNDIDENEIPNGRSHTQFKEKVVKLSPRTGKHILPHLATKNARHKDGSSPNMVDESKQRGDRKTDVKGKSVNVSQMNGNLSPRNAADELESNEKFMESPRSTCRSKKRTDFFRMGQKEREEELRKQLKKAYYPICPPSLFSDFRVGQPKSLPPSSIYSQPTCSSAPRPIHYSGEGSDSDSGSISSYYHSTSSHPIKPQSTAIQMTPYGMRKVPLDCNSNGLLKGGTNPRIGLGQRTRTALVFVEPNIYEDVLKEEHRKDSVF